MGIISGPPRCEVGRRSLQHLEILYVVLGRVAVSFKFADQGVTAVFTNYREF